jgi:uncharacterized protein YxjI
MKVKYQIKQKIFSIADGFKIKNDAGEDVYTVKSQLLSIGNKLKILDLSGNELCYIEQKLLKFMPEYKIIISGQEIATVKKKFSLLRNNFIINGNGGDFTVEGNYTGHEFKIKNGNTVVAVISKKFFSMSDTYGVEIDDGQDQIVGLALAIVIDMVCHDKK